MAEGYFNSLTKKNALDEKLAALSAGLHAFEGSPANERSRIACLRDHIDLSGHQSKPTTKELVDQASLILTMTKDHKDELIEQFPHAGNKTFTLMEYAGQNGDIPDPIGLSEQTYETTYQQIKEAVQLVFEKVK